MDKGTIETNQSTKRGWLFDLLMDIGHAEAELTHQDENIVNDYHDMKESTGTEEDVNRVVDDLSTRHEVEKLIYESRAKDLDMAFDVIEGSNRHWFCDVKHAAARFVLGAETYHASGFDPRLEETLVLKGRILALVCSKAFNMEVMDCMRCLNDALNAKMGFDQKDLMIATIAPDSGVMVSREAPEQLELPFDDRLETDPKLVPKNLHKL